MRKVKVYRWEQIDTGNKNRFGNIEYRTEKIFDNYGLFHKIGLNFEEFDDGVGTYSTAIVEMPDGTMQHTDIEMIEFVEPLYEAFYGEDI